jgi:hypothetical protein
MAGTTAAPGLSEDQRSLKVRTAVEACPENIALPVLRDKVLADRIRCAYGLEKERHATATTLGGSLWPLETQLLLRQRSPAATARGAPASRSTADMCCQSSGNSPKTTFRTLSCAARRACGNRARTSGARRGLKPRAGYRKPVCVAQRRQTARYRRTQLRRSK